MSTCSIPGCGKRHFGHGWCTAHYHRWRRHGDPTGGGTPNGAPERYIRKLLTDPEVTECITWPFYRDKNGYGRVCPKGKTLWAHRVICALAHGEPPSPEHEASHLCGKGHEGCVNPFHLCWKTVSENKADMVVHGTSSRGERHGASKLSATDVFTIRAFEGRLTHERIAKQFGVGRQTVSDILSRKRWGWLHEEELAEQWRTRAEMGRMP